MAGNNSTGFDLNAGTTTQPVAILDSGWMLAAAIQYYLYCATIGIGIIGAGANAVVLYALILHNLRETKKRVINWLIINQNLLDLCCCIMIVIVFPIRVSNPYLTNTLGYVVCALLHNGNVAYCVLNASVINLMSLTVERYLKVVYPFWSKKTLKSWMIYAAIVFSWVAGILSAGPMGFVTSFVAEGTCYGYELVFSDPELKAGYGIWNFFTFSLIPLVLFVYCYGHIVVVMRKQVRVMAGHSGEAQKGSQSKRVKWNIIKTMMIVSAFFVACWFPMNVYIMVADNPMATSDLAIAYLVAVFLPYVNIIYFASSLFGPFYGAIAVPSVTRCRCRRCRGHRGAGGVRQWQRATVATPGEWQCKTGCGFPAIRKHLPQPVYLHIQTRGRQTHLG